MRGNGARSRLTRYRKMGIETLSSVAASPMAKRHRFVNNQQPGLGLGFGILGSPICKSVFMQKVDPSLSLIPWHASDDVKVVTNYTAPSTFISTWTDVTNGLSWSPSFGGPSNDPGPTGFILPFWQAGGFPAHPTDWWICRRGWWTWSATIATINIAFANTLFMNTLAYSAAPSVFLQDTGSQANFSCDGGTHTITGKFPMITDCYWQPRWFDNSGQHFFNTFTLEMIRTDSP